MNYKEYALSVRDAPVCGGLVFKPTGFWHRPGELPLRLVGRDRSAAVVKVPPRASNRYGEQRPVVSFAPDVFSGDEAVTDIILPPTVRSIPAGAFAGCSGLKNVTIPKSVMKIGKGTFDGCSGLEDVYYEGTREEWEKIDVVRERFEKEFGGLIPGTPVSELVDERRISVPGNEALSRATVHFGCDPEDCY